MSPRSERNQRLLEQAIREGLRHEGQQVISKTGRRLSATAGRGGYLYVKVCANGEQIKLPLGRVICWLAHGPPPTIYYDADHIDNVKTNNDPANLRWLTQAENTKRRVNDPSKRQGEKSHLAVLTTEDVMMAKRMWARGESRNSIAMQIGASVGAIYDAIQGRTWAHLKDAVPAMSQDEITNAS